MPRHVLMHLQAGCQWFTADNAPNNDTALKEFGRVVDPEKTRWDPIGRRVRYVVIMNCLQMY